MKNKIIVNLLSPPSGGKSTTRAGIFYFLKVAGIRCEEAIEYAKGKVYEGSDPVLKNQIYVFGKQHHMTTRCMGQVNVIVSESPLLLSIVYDEEYSEHPSSALKALVLEEHSKFINMNYYLVKPKDRPYEEYGRTQKEAGANIIGDRILRVLGENNIPYKTLESTHEIVLLIVEEVKAMIKSLEDEGEIQ